MNAMPPYPPSVLRQATPAQLEQAVARNHEELFCLNAVALGGEVKTVNGLTCTHEGLGRGATIAFPSLPASSAGAQLDEIMTWFREQPPKSAGCWSLHPPQPADLGVRLLARGFQPGWRPCWMALDLDALVTHHTCPAGLQINANNSTSTHRLHQLPYSGENGAVSQAVLDAHPNRAQRFIATLQGQIVGQSCVLLTSGDYGVAGIYNVGVVPAARNQGIGKAVVRAACLYAKERGYQYAVLNATGRRMYEQVGFQWIGDGFTWWLMSRRYLTHPPSPREVALAEAVGRGDMAALKNMAPLFSKEELNAPITNGMTLLQLAAHCQQPAAADWLVKQGAVYNVLDAWDLGWKSRAAALLQAHPEQVNQLHGNGGLTLLHIAAERNDPALAALALSAHPNLEIQDKIYQGTPLGWAMHLGREEIAELIKQYREQA